MESGQMRKERVPMSELGKFTPLYCFFLIVFFKFRLVNTLKTRTTSFFRFDMGISRFILDSDFVINNNCIFIFFIIAVFELVDTALCRSNYK